ncbi:MAG TPA: endonuclease Q family protein [Candidatus Paceibacterota bacterium]|nr:endonuclease Q family protein [Candidatus Pacearchaeota archaeon]HRZ50741.1 endonuclease Q family protein [Candidatus Paceibacterota bacterium]HSA36362.1 endonuclease Q family protein [Candidatus Paceibacterota bacterium]
MKFAADLHLHSRFSRATSANMNIRMLDAWARIKGIRILGTGDFTHPEWLLELKNDLEPAEPGLFKLKGKNSPTRFLFTAEICCIYSKNGKVRKVHIVIFAPSLEVAEKINARLSSAGNLAADGRPILGLDSLELAKIVFDASDQCMVIPAHAMTPWFGIFGSKSGFDSLEECFGEYAKYIYAIETGLSADPGMLWRIPDGRRAALISNSDAHSPQKLAREANIFETEIDYFEITNAIKEKDPQKFLYTVEFFPAEGKYHFDGHRACNVCFSPQESKKYNGNCPACGRPLTIGVVSRIEELADQPEGYRPDGTIPYRHFIPLQEIIADALKVMAASKQVQMEYDNLIKGFGSEFSVLLGPDYGELARITLPEIAEGVIRVREGKVRVIPGYDGVFGKIKIFDDEIVEKITNTQKRLF